MHQYNTLGESYSPNGGGSLDIVAMLAKEIAAWVRFTPVVQQTEAKLILKARCRRPHQTNQLIIKLSIAINHIAILLLILLLLQQQQQLLLQLLLPLLLSFS